MNDILLEAKTNLNHPSIIYLQSLLDHYEMTRDKTLSGFYDPRIDERSQINHNGCVQVFNHILEQLKEYEPPFKAVAGLHQGDIVIYGDKSSMFHKMIVPITSINDEYQHDVLAFVNGYANINIHNNNFTFHSLMGSARVSYQDEDFLVVLESFLIRLDLIMNDLGAKGFFGIVTYVNLHAASREKAILTLQLSQECY